MNGRRLVRRSADAMSFRRIKILFCRAQHSRQRPQAEVELLHRRRGKREPLVKTGEGVASAAISLSTALAVISVTGWLIFLGIG